MSARTLVLVIVIGLVLAGVWIVASGRPEALAARNQPCWPGTMALALSRQSVPAAYVPCLQDGPGVWQVDDIAIDSDAAVYRLRLGRGTAWTIRLDSTCDLSGTMSAGDVGSTIVLDQTGHPGRAANMGGVQHYISATVPGQTLNRTDYYVFSGGCVSSEVDASTDVMTIMPLINRSLRLITAPGGTWVLGWRGGEGAATK
jgi:hypothetical protein